MFKKALNWLGVYWDDLVKGVVIAAVVAFIVINWKLLFGTSAGGLIEQYLLFAPILFVGRAMLIFLALAVAGIGLQSWLQGVTLKGVGPKGAEFDRASTEADEKLTKALAAKEEELKKLSENLRKKEKENAILWDLVKGVKL